MDRDTAVDRLEAIVDAVEVGPLPVPVTEVWASGDVALGVDPLRRLDVYVAKRLPDRRDPDVDAEYRKSHGVAGVGTVVHADWARAHPEAIRANHGGFVAPEKCLTAFLLDDEQSHLEVCNVGFEDGVTKRLRGALARETFHEIIDPRGVCLYADGERSDTAFDRLRAGDFDFPTLADALAMLVDDEEAARTAAGALQERCETAAATRDRRDDD